KEERLDVLRLDVLRKVYSPLLIHKEGTQEWNKLIESGKVWEDCFRPFEWRAQDYLIDGLKTSAKISSVDILKRLTVNFAQHNMPLPAPSSLSDKPENEVIKIRNHLLVNYFLYNTFYESVHEIGLDDIKMIHRIMLKDTPLERAKLSEGYQHVGEFRKVEVEARGSIYTVYP
ncbi:13240_t:CDS:2, partial [Racocetra persica]